MAQEGRVFTDFNVTQAVCSASRAGLVTGCYNVRVGILGALGPGATHGINSDEMTIAELVKQKDTRPLVSASGIWGITPSSCPPTTALTSTLAYLLE